MGTIKTLWEKYYLHSLALFVFTFLIYIFWFYTSFFYSAIINYSWVSSDIFDGSVYPIEYIPNPIELTYEQRKQKFEEIDSKFFIKTPVYNPEIFWKDLENLTTGTQIYNEAITQKVLYTVPYLSTYNFDYKEYSGSHPWVDIVVPEWTPVRNIANGFIVDVGYQPSGFWNYVLVKHSWVPYAGKTQTLYSLYAHLSKALVTHGKKISKWELIWLVWESGTATVPHLHFQLEAEDIPYRPFWPFSTSDMKQAGVGFFEAVNIGLWKEKALLYTLNPLKFVNETYKNILYTNTPTQEPNLDIVEDEEVSNIQKWENDTEQPSISNEQNPLTEEKGESTSRETISEQENTVIDENTNKTVAKEEVLNYEVELLSAIDVDEIILQDSPHMNSFQEETSRKNEENSDAETLIDEKDESIIQKPETFSDANTDERWDKLLSPEESSSSGISSQSGKILFSDIDDEYEYKESLEYFKEHKIISWFSDGSFRPKNNITRVEALKIILLANKIQPINDKPSQFQDIFTNTWENTYINAGVENGILSLDNTLFSPFRNVSRVEALKLILTLGKVDLDAWEKYLIFDDVTESDWYYSYVHYAIKNSLIEIENNLFKPNTPITREELVAILYKYIQK